MIQIIKYISKNIQLNMTVDWNNLEKLGYLQASEEEIEEAEDHLEDKIAEFGHLFNQVQTKIKELKLDLEKVQTNQRSQLAKIVTIRNDIRKQKDDLEKYRQKCRALEIENENNRKNVILLKSQLNTLQNDYQHQFEEDFKDHCELASWMKPERNSNINDYTNQSLDRLQSSIDTLTRRIEKLEIVSKITDKDPAPTQNSSELDKNIVEIESEITKLKVEETELLAKIKTFETQMEDARSKCCRAKSTLKNCNISHNIKSLPKITQLITMVSQI
jgi:chromosome segregation ATPase